MAHGGVCWRTKNTPTSHCDSLVVVGSTKAGEDEKNTPTSHNDSLVVLVVDEGGEDKKKTTSHRDSLVWWLRRLSCEEESKQGARDGSSRAPSLVVVIVEVLAVIVVHFL